LVVPAGNLHILPDAVTDEAAVLVEPLAAAIRTFEFSPLGSDDVVAILGCGRLGRLIALVAHKAGARVVAIGRSASHLESIAPFAWKRIALGREPSGEGIEFAQSEMHLRETMLKLTDGLGAGVTVEATGVNANVRLAQMLTRPQGTVSLKSTSGIPVDGFDATMAIVNELRFQGTRCGPFPKAIEFMLTHGVPDSSWITAQFPLARTAEAIEAAAHEAKVLIQCRSN
jgi:threonine dehydrogenase-like Zn-dependent dehydrogenase